MDKLLLSQIALVVGLISAGLSFAQELDIVVSALFTNKALIEINGQQHILKIGQSSPEGVTLISATSREAVLEHNGNQKEYPVGTKISSGFSKPSEKQSVKILLNKRGQFVSAGSVNGYPVEFLVDTGANGVSLTAATAKAAGIDYRYLGRKTYSNTANGKAVIYVLPLDSVKLGPIEVKNVRAAVHEDNGLTVNLLGMSYLQYVDMTQNGNSLIIKRKY